MGARPKFPSHPEPGLLSGIVLGTLSLLWHLVRIPILVVLRLAEPFVRLTLVALGMLSLLGALFYAVASSLPHSPVVPLLGFGVGCGLTLILYDRIVRFFS